MILRKRTKTARQYARRLILRRIAFILGCLALGVLGFFSAGPVLSWLGF